MKIIIIGYIDLLHPTGPSDVVSSLIKGLKELRADYEFINSYCETKKEKYRFYRRLFKLLFSKKLSINVHTWGFKVPLLVYLISKINKNNQYFLTVHGISSYENQLNHCNNSKLRSIIEKRLYEGMPKIICVSNFARDFFWKFFNHRNNVFVISNGLLNFQENYIEKTGLKFVYAGGYSNLKGPLECLDIFKEIHAIYPKAELTMCGPVLDNKLYQKVNEVVELESLNESVVLRQKLTKNKLNNIYEEASFILAPSSFDTFNMTVLEAMNMGCIPIISQNCGIKDVIGNKCGIIYEERSEVLEWIKNIKVDEQIKKSFELSLKNTYLEMAEKYMKVVG